MSSVCPRNMTAHCVSGSMAACLWFRNITVRYMLNTLCVVICFQNNILLGTLCEYFRITTAHCLWDRTVSMFVRHKTVCCIIGGAVFGWHKNKAAIRQCDWLHMITAQFIRVCAVRLHLRNNTFDRITDAALYLQIKNTSACGLTPEHDSSQLKG
jgi:hypothetical protein